MKQIYPIFPIILLAKHIVLHATVNIFDPSIQVSAHDTIPVKTEAIAHEIVHYRQWITRSEINESQAIRRGIGMVRKYARTAYKP